MDTKILVDEHVVFPVTIDKDTGEIYIFQSDIAALSPSGEVPAFNLRTFLKDVDRVAFNVYVEFLRDHHVEIIDRPTMIGCLTIYSLTEDKNFLKHILSQLFKYWTLLSPVLYDLRVANEIKYDIWQYCPKQLLPQEWLDDPIFMTAWKANPDNKNVKLNGEERLYAGNFNEIEGTIIKQGPITHYSRVSDATSIDVKNETVLRSSLGKTVEVENNQYQTLSQGTRKDIEHGLVVKEAGDEEVVSVHLEGYMYGLIRGYKDGILDYEEYVVPPHDVISRVYFEAGRPKFAIYDTDDGLAQVYESFYSNEANSPRFALYRTTDFHPKVIKQIAYHPDTSYIVSEGQTRSIYDEQGRLVERLVISPDGSASRLLYGANGKVESETDIGADYVKKIDEEISSQMVSIRELLNHQL